MSDSDPRVEDGKRVLGIVPGTPAAGERKVPDDQDLVMTSPHLLVRHAVAAVEPQGEVRRCPTRNLQDLELLDDPGSCTNHNVGAEDDKVFRTDMIWRQAAACPARRSRTCKVRHKAAATAGMA